MSQEILDQATKVDGRHPFDQGVSAMHWGIVTAEINSRHPKLPDLNLTISDIEPEAIPSSAVLYDATKNESAISEMQSDQSRLDRARNAWASFITTARFPELKPLMAPALAVSIAACGGAETPATQNNATEAPVVTVSPATPTPNESAVVPETPPASDPLETGKPNTGNVSPEPTFTPEPTPELTVDQVIDQIIHQEKADIKNTDFNDLKNELNLLWDKYGDVISQVPFMYSETKKVTKEILMDKGVLNGLKGDPSEPEKLRINNRVNSAASLAAFKLYLYENITDPEAKAELIKAADMFFDYGMTSIPQYPGKPAFNKTLLSKSIPAFLSQFRTLK